MKRILTLLTTGWLALAVFAIVDTGAALADDPSAEPPVARTTSEVISEDLASEPAIPYIVALLVTSAGLTIVGFVALRIQHPGPGYRPPPDRALEHAASGPPQTRRST